MPLNPNIEMPENEKKIPALRDLLPTKRITEMKHIYINTFWLTLSFAIVLAIFIFFKA